MFLAQEYHKWHFFDSRSNLPHRINNVWKIDSGLVKGYTLLEDGSIVTLGVWSNSEIISHTFTNIKPYELECLTEVKASLVPWKKSEENIDLLLTYIQSVHELGIIRDYKTTDLMIIKLFDWLGKKIGKRVPNGKLIDVRLTHQDIADILGITRVTVTRNLNHLEKQGRIKQNSLHRFVLNEEEIWHYEI
ncbi:Crp/Fnr family transcriptional regulator [Synechocystis sp. FACHB-383]|nr:Crp/Fnr family transcriptional regulator [Synechocystis sp. FACHB-383]